MTQDQLIEKLTEISEQVADSVEDPFSLGIAYSALLQLIEELKND